MNEHEPGWVDRLARVAVEYRSANESIRDLFAHVGPDLGDPRMLELIRRRLTEEPALIAAWQSYSDARRGSPSPYLSGPEVGFLELRAGKLLKVGVRRHSDHVEACADFIRREAMWVLEGATPE